MKDAPEDRDWRTRSAKRSFPLPKGVSGDPLWHIRRRDVERGKKGQRGWTEAYPENWEEKCFPMCLIISLSSFSQCLNQ